ncbi:hypothetical protein J437_LFUL017899 [Ladona fulva]|uniref:Uncharacterized protein n=1 Tax=Ladona fulva TaxID=123851 RepID=A0A8K0P8I6_LADFU|nr:hypothetical protein J437_LFUL017899 [Ladona fulva]
MQEAPDAVFQQYDVARNVQCLFKERQMSLPPWPACSPDMSHIKHDWDMVGRQLLCCDPPATTVDDLWMRLQTVWQNSYAGRLIRRYHEK